VLRAVGSSSAQPDSWRQRFHHVRKAAARFGKGRAEIFSGTVSYSHGQLGSKTFHVSGSSAQELGAALDKARGNVAAASTKAKTNLKRAATSPKRRKSEKIDLLPRPSELASVSTKARNLCVLNARLDASEMLASSAQMVRSKVRGCRLNLSNPR